MNMEKDVLDILQQKNKMLKSCEEHIEALASDKKAFIAEQRGYIDELHKFLEEKYTNIVTQYNEAIENDLLNIKN